MSLDKFFLEHTGPWVALCAALVLILSTLILGWVSPKEAIKARLKADYFSTDSTFGYTPDDLYTMLDKYRTSPSDEFDAHKTFILYDLIYPWFYAITAALLIAYLLPSLSADYRHMRFLTLLPVAAAVFDYLENITMYFILRSYPQRVPALVLVSRTMTMLKLVLIYATLFLILVGLVTIIGRGISNIARRSTSSG